MTLKIRLLILLLIASLAFGLCQEKTPAFPGAEGYGKYVTGGRGGDVVYVTHLKDNTDKWGAGYAGSLRAALETPGNSPITILFKVGGVIEIQTALECTRSNITIAGQTALGEGICIRGAGIQFSGNNIIVRHMRFRVGDENIVNDPALTFSNGKNAIFDHCSFSWSIEENVNITDVDSITLQWCINSESLYDSYHGKGERGYAAQWGGMNSTYHHNLLAHHNSRMPRQNGSRNNDKKVTWDYRNNVHYNWGNNGAFYGGEVDLSEGFCHSNLINNYYIPGPATTTDKNSQYFCAPSLGKYNPPVYGYGQWYLEGNIMYDNTTKTNDNFSGLDGPEEHKASSAFAVMEINTNSAEQAYLDVLENAGATLPKRDSIDIRIIEEVKSRTATYGGAFGSSKGIIDSQNGIKPDGADSDWHAWNIYTSITKYSAPTDTDEDGIPNWWEGENGLDSMDINDGKALASDNSGYTNLEIYLNSDDVVRSGPTSIEKHSMDWQYSIYPNPVGDFFKIKYNSRPVRIEIFNLLGVKIKEYKNTVGNTYSVSSLKRGQYFVRITNVEGNQYVLKFTK